MFLFNPSIWEQYKERFAKSYQIAEPVSRLTGYAEMTDHIYLTDDMKVQQTVFSNRVRVTVNFGSTDYKTKNGDVIEPMGSLVEENYSDAGTDGWVVLVIVACFVVVVTVVYGFAYFRKK